MAKAVEDLYRQAAGIGSRLQQQWGNRADEHSLLSALRAVATDVALDLAAARGVADLDRIQVESLDQFGLVIGIGVEVDEIPRVFAAVTLSLPTLFEKREGTTAEGHPLRKGFRREEVLTVVSVRGRLALPEYLRLKVRYFARRCWEREPVPKVTFFGM